MAKLEMTNSSHQCPPGITLMTDLPRCLCRTSVLVVRAIYPPFFNIYGIQYGQVLGRLSDIRLQMNLVRDSYIQPIDGNTVGGISLN